MKKAIICNPSDESKVALSTYSVEIIFSDDKKEISEFNLYTYDDVFEAIKEKYDGNTTKVESVIIKTIDGM